METISGFVEHITYRNEENGYTVLSLQREKEGRITCVGDFRLVHEGERLEVAGEYQRHQNYGLQFKSSSFRILPPDDETSIERYLGSGAVKGVGKALASRIVEAFGRDTMRILEEEPERLSKVKGISRRMAAGIAEQIAGESELREAVIFLQQYGISLKLSVKIYQTYGNTLYQIISDNPYRLAEDVDGVGFKIADEIAARMGIRRDLDFRIRSGILYALITASAEGHTCLPQEELTQRAAILLDVPREAIEKLYIDMAIEKKLVIRDECGETRIYAAVFYHMEADIAAMLKELNVKFETDGDMIKKAIGEIEAESGIVLDQSQRTAVREAAGCGLSVITGGPGTGKTTIIQAIIRYLDAAGSEIYLAAPTGRAAKKMSEATGFEARTIHRMLEVSGEIEGKAGFARNEERPLEADAVIIDEMSMVDVPLMYALLKAVSVGTRLILVGDADQLPSVGPGAVLKDIIAAHICSVARLENIFRQESESAIILNAHKIKRGEEIDLDERNRDFLFLKRGSVEEIIGVCIALIRDKLPSYLRKRPTDIQLLSPTRKGLLGVENLNRVLQRHLNPPAEGKRERAYGDQIFREGDRVMQIRNNYKMEWEILGPHGARIDQGTGVFNGDVGIIRQVGEGSFALCVEFDEGRLVRYSPNQLGELEPAYAITIHKAQGSEYSAVVIPLMGGPEMLMNRNILYTALTRARECVVFVGDAHTFYRMAANVSEQRRLSGLRERLEETAP